jgi:hypothetical protein
MAKLARRRDEKSGPLADAAAALVAERAKELQSLRRKLTHEYQARYAHLVPEWEIQDLGHDIANEAALTFDPSSEAKITTYYWFLFGRRMVSLLEKHGHRLSAASTPGGEQAPDDHWLPRSEVSILSPNQIPDRSSTDEPPVDPLTPFSISDAWLANRSKTFLAAIILIKEQLPEDKQIIWWADAMGRELSAEDLERLGSLKGRPMTEEAIRKARHDANRKVAKIRDRVRGLVCGDDHNEVPPRWFTNPAQIPR